MSNHSSGPATSPRLPPDRLTVEALDRMILSCESDIRKQDHGNHATIGFLQGEIKGYRNARLYLIEAMRATPSESATPKESLEGLLTFVENGLRTNSLDVSDWQSDLESVRDVLKILVLATPSAIGTSTWISVKERLPDQEGRYLAATKALLEDGLFVAVTRYTPQEHAYINGWSSSGVKFWMPLPEAPHG